MLCMKRICKMRPELRLWKLKMVSLKGKYIVRIVLLLSKVVHSLM